MISPAEMQAAAGTIRTRREALGLSRAQLAREAGGISESTVKVWETSPDRDIKRPTVSQLPKILDALDRLEAVRTTTGEGERAPFIYHDPDTDAVVAMLNYLPPEQRRQAIEWTLDMINAIRTGQQGSTTD